MRTHNIYFCGEIRKISVLFGWKKHLIWPYRFLRDLSKNFCLMENYKEYLSEHLFTRTKMLNCHWDLMEIWEIFAIFQYSLISVLMHVWQILWNAALHQRNPQRYLMQATSRVYWWTKLQFWHLRTKLGLVLLAFHIWASIWKKGPKNLCNQWWFRPACASAWSGQGLCCLPTQHKDLVEDIGLIAKVLTQRVAVQYGLGLHPLYTAQGPFL